VLRDLRAVAEKDLLPAMRAVDPAASIAIATTSDYAPLAAEKKATFLALVEEITGSRAACVSFATEAGVYQRSGIPTLVCGPGYIAQAHRPDEFLDATQLEACERFVDTLASRFSASSDIASRA